MSALFAVVLLYGPYRAIVAEVLDAGVLRLEIEVWPGVKQQVEFRLEDIGKPRADSTCEGEQLLAADARDFTRTFAGKFVVVSRVRKADRGDWFTGRVRNTRGADLGAALIGTGYAVSAKRRVQSNPWCPQPP